MMNPRASVELASIITLLSKLAGLPGGTVRRTRGKPRWERWLAIIDEHQLGPFIASRMLLNGSNRESPFPKWIEDALLQRYVRSGHEAAFRTAEVARLTETFDATEPPVLLKGAAVALTLYSEPAERMMSDLDLLFPTTESLRSARSSLIKQGYRAPKPTAGPVVPIDHHHEAPLSSTASELTFELHTNLTTPPLPQGAIRDMWRRRQTIDAGGGREVYVLDGVSALIHHALHAVADPIDSPLLRNLFEVAWLASKLDRSERATLRALAQRWHLGSRLSLALGLAAQLFGSPPIVTLARHDFRRWWCTSRLEWTRSFADDLSMRDRLKRHLARLHFAAVDRGASPHSPFPILSALLASVKSAVRSRLERRSERRERPQLPAQIEPVTIQTALVAGCLLAHDRSTGNVHLLDQTSTAAYAKVNEPKPTRVIEAELQALGLETPRSQAVIERLLEAGLVRRARS